jgi:hypothetical protein
MLLTTKLGVLIQATIITSHWKFSNVANNSSRSVRKIQELELNIMAGIVGRTTV